MLSKLKIPEYWTGTLITFPSYAKTINDLGGGGGWTVNEGKDIKV